MTGGTAGAKTALVPDMHEGMFGTGAFLTFRENGPIPQTGKKRSDAVVAKTRKVA